MQVNFNNGSWIKPISPINKLFKNKNEDKNGKGERSKYIAYYCGLCDTMHYKTYEESYLIDGNWYCKEAWDRL